MAKKTQITTAAATTALAVSAAFAQTPADSTQPAAVSQPSSQPSSQPADISATQPTTQPTIQPTTQASTPSTTQPDPLATTQGSGPTTFILPAATTQPVVKGPAQSIRFQFDGIPFADAVRIFAQMANKPLVGDLNIQGNLTYFDSEPYKYNDALDTFNLLLSMQGYTLIESGRFLQLVQLKDIGKMPLRILHGLDNTDKIPQGEIVTVVLPLKYIDSVMAEKIVQPMVSSFGTLAALGATKGLIITDRLGTIQRIRTLLKEFDVQTLADQQIRTYPLKAASARDISNIINSLFGTLARSGARVVPREEGKPPEIIEGPQQLLAYSDDRTNSVIVFGSGSTLSMAEEMIMRLDAPDGPTSGAPSSSLRIFELKAARAEDVANTLRQAFVDGPTPAPVGGGGPRGGPPRAIANTVPTRIIPDPATNRLVVSAPAENLAKIEALISQLDQATTEIGGAKIFHLKSADAQQVASIINLSVFDRDKAGKIIPKLNVAADPRSNSVVVAGAAGDIGRAERLVAELDIPPEKQTREIHVIRLAAGDAAQIAPALTRLFTEQAGPGPQNKIAPRIEPDPVTNSLFISCSPNDWTNLQSMLTQLKSDAIPDVVPATRIIPVEHARASEIAAALQPLFTNQARASNAKRNPTNVVITASDRANTILVSATADNHQIIADMVKSMDVAANDKIDPVKIIKLQSADALKLADTLRAMPAPAAQPGSTPISILADPVTNSVIIRAPEAHRLMLEDMISKLDQATQDDARQLQIIQLKHLAATPLIPVINQLNPPTPPSRTGVATDAHVSIVAAPGDRALVIDAPRSKAKQIAELVQTLDTDQSESPTQQQVRMYQLASSRAWEVAPTLARLFASQQPAPKPGVAPPSIPAPRFEADNATNQVIVSATPDQFKDIEPLITKLASTNSLAMQTKAYQIKNVQAVEVYYALQPMVQDSSATVAARRPGAPDTSARVSILNGNNSVIVQGPPDKIAIADQVIASLDVSPNATSQMQVRTYALTGVMAYEIAPTLARLFQAQAQQQRPGAPATAQGPQPRFEADYRSNQLMISATDDQFKEIEPIIKSMQITSVVAVQTKTFPLKNIRCDEAYYALSAMLQDSPATIAARKPGTPDTAARVAMIYSNNAVLVQGTPEKLAIADQVITSLDIDRTGTNFGQMQVRTYQLSGVRANEIAPTLARLFTQQQQGRPGNLPPTTLQPRFESDYTTNQLMISATDAQFKDIEPLVKSLQVGNNLTSQTKTFNLKFSNAQEIAYVLGPMLADPPSVIAARKPGSPDTSARVAAAPTINAVVVQGLPERIATAEQVIASLDIDHANIQSGNQMVVHSYQLTSSRAADIAPSLARLFSAQQQQLQQRNSNVPTISPPPQPRFEADPTTNQLLIAATVDQFKDIEVLIKKLENGAVLANQTKTFNLKFAQASDVVGVLSPMLADPALTSGQKKAGAPDTSARVAIANAANAVVIQGTAEKVALAEQIIASLDVAQAADSSSITVVTLKNAQAITLADAINKTLDDTSIQSPGQRPIIGAPGRPTRVIVTAEINSNSLLVRGPQERVPAVVEMIHGLDSNSAPNTGTAQIRVYTLEHNKAADLAPTLSKLFADMTRPKPGSPANTPVVPFTASSDARTNSLIVSTSPKYFTVVEQLLKSLDTSETGTGSDVKIVSLEHAQAFDVAETVKSMYASRKVGDRPVIESDETSNTLTVIAREGDFKDIEPVITKLDAAARDTSLHVRVIPLTQGRADNMAQVVKSVYGQMTGSTVTITEKPADAKPVNGSAKPDDKKDDTVTHTIQMPSLLRETTYVVALAGALAATPAEAAEPAQPAQPAAQPVAAQPVTQSAPAAAAQPAPAPTPPPAAADQPKGVTISVDKASNALIVSGSRQEVDAVEALISKLQTSAGKGDSEYRYYRITQADPDSIAHLLDELFNPKLSPQAQAQLQAQAQAARVGARGQPGQPPPPAEPGAMIPPPVISVIADQRTHLVVVRAKPTDFVVIDELVKQLDESPTTISELRIFSLKNTDAAEIAGNLRELFAAALTSGAGNEERPADAKPEKLNKRAMRIRQAISSRPRTGNAPPSASFSVSANKAANSIVVAAPADLMTVVEAIVQELDQSAADSMLPTVRLYPVANAKVTPMVSVLRELFTAPKVAKGGQAPASGHETPIIITGDEAGRTVVVSAAPDKQELISHVITDMDKRQEGKGVKTQILFLQNARALDIAAVLVRVATPAPGRGQNPGAADQSNSPQMIVSADAASNAVVLSGVEADVAHLVEMAQQLDQATTGGKAGVYILPLKNGDATGVATVIKELYAQQVTAAQRTKQIVEPLAVSADERANALIIAASKPMYDQVAQWVTQVETMKPAKGSVKIITLQNADPAEVDKAIKEIFIQSGAQPAGKSGGKPGAPKPAGGGAGGTSSSIDTSVLTQQKAIMVSASDEDFVAIQKLVQALDQAAAESKRQTRVFKLQRANNQRVADAINGAYRAAAGRPAAADEQVTVTALPQTDALVVSAPGKKLEDIAHLIEELDKTEIATQLEFRIFKLANATPTRILPVLTQMIAQLQKAHPADPINAQADERTRSVIITARGTVFDEVGKIIETLDKPAEFGKAEVIVIPLVKADAVHLAQILNDMLRPSPTGQVTPEALALQDQVRRLRIRKNDVQEPSDLPELDLTQPIKISADAAAQGSNSLIVSSTPDNIKALRVIVAMMDTVPVVADAKVRIVHLKNADATQAAAILTQIFTQGLRLSGKAGAPGAGKAEPVNAVGKALVNTVTVSADARTNSLIIAGQEESLALADLILKDVDRETADLVTDVRVFHVLNADVTKMATVLQSVFAESPAAAAGSEGLKTQVTRLRTLLESKAPLQSEIAKTRPALTIQADATTQSLVVAARSDVMPLIADVIKTMDIPGSSTLNAVRIFPLQNADAIRIKPVIDSLYTGPASADLRKEDKPIISVDTRTNALVVAGSDRTFAVVDQLIRQLDSKTPVNLNDIKLIPLKNSDAGTLAKTIQQMMDARLQRMTAIGGKDTEALKVVILADPRSNSLMVTGPTEGFDVVKNLAAQLDGADRAVSSDIQLIPLKYANAGALATTLQRLFQQRHQNMQIPGTAAGPASSQPVILPDVRTNSLMVAAATDDSKVLNDLMNRLDVQLSSPAVRLEVIPLKHNDTASVAPMITSIFKARQTAMTPQGQPINPQDQVDVSVDPLTNSLIISASAENFTLIHGLLDKVDVLPPTDSGVVRMFPLQNSDAQRVATMLQGLISQGLYKPGVPLTTANAASAAREKVAIATDLRTNVLIISASKENFAVIEEIIKGIDLSPDAVANGDIKVYNLIRADATRLAPTLQQFFNAKRTGEQQAGAAGRSLPVNIIADIRTNSLLVTGSRESFAAMDTLVKKLDGDQTLPLNEFRVFYLKNGSAPSLQPTIQLLFDQRALRAETPQNPVTVIADPRTNSLIIGAKRDDLDLADALVKKLDAEPETPGYKVAVFPLQQADALSVAATLRSIYQSPASPLGQNPISNQQPGAQQTPAAAGPRLPGQAQQNQPLGVPNSIPPAGPTSLVAISADTRLNAIVVSAAPDEIDRISDLVKQLDGASNAQVTEIRVFALSNSDATELSTILSTAIKGAPNGGLPGGTGAGATPAPGAPGSSPLTLQFMTRAADGQSLVSSTLKGSVLITPDKRSNSLVVSAPVENMELIEKLIKSMDTASPTSAEIRVMRLQNADATQMATIFTSLFQMKASSAGPARQFSYTLVPTTQPSFDGQVRIEGADKSPVVIGAAEQASLNVTVDPRTNSLIIGGTRKYVDLCSKIIAELDSSPAQERVTQIYRLKNSQAVDIQLALRSFLDQERQRIVADLGADKVGAAQRILDRDVAVVAEKTSNTLLLSASPRYFDVVSKMVKELDRPVPQVLIEVMLAEVTLDDTTAMGFEWQYTKQIGSATAKTGTDLGIASDLAKKGGFGAALSGGDLSLVFRALQTQGKLEVLSRPQLLAADNQMAKINVGQLVPIVTDSRVSGDVNPITVNSIKYQDVGIGLTVTPRINDDGLIRLDVSPTVSAIAAETVQISPGFNAPIIDNRTVTTTVTVQDGHTIVIGGIIDTQNSLTVKKVPIVGDIPLIGFLFKDTQTEKKRTELLIVLTPRIVQNIKLADYMTDKEIEESNSNHRESRVRQMERAMNSAEDPAQRPYSLPVDNDNTIIGAPLGPGDSGASSGFVRVTPQAQPATSQPSTYQPQSVVIPDVVKP